MVNPVGFRFHPTDVEIIYHYLRPKNLDSDTRHVDQVISTVSLCRFDPWDLPFQSSSEQRDEVSYFFGRKENKYKRGTDQVRKTKSGFWKKTGPTMNIMGKNGNRREKIGEKKVLVFHMSKTLGGSKTNWVTHEYHAKSLSHNQIMSYTVCKVKFKGEERDISSSSDSEIGPSQSLVPLVNKSEGSGTRSEESSFGLLFRQELENPSLFSGVSFLGEQQETQIEDANDLWDFDNMLSTEWTNFLDGVV